MLNLTITNLVGIFLIIAGAILAAIQLTRKITAPNRGASANLGKFNFALTTTFPGIIMIALGVILVIVAALTGK
jgi:heme/copper-type cytochrome/quinol oxidase subunit 2